MDRIEIFYNCMKQLFLSVILLLPFTSCDVGSKNIPEMQGVIIYTNANAKSMTEGRRSVAGRILIPPPTGEVYVQIVTSTDKEIKARWPGWERAMFINSRWHGEDLESYQYRKYLWKQTDSIIDPLQEYQIDILTAIYTDPNILEDEIWRVSKNGRVVIDASICQIHKAPMMRQIERPRSADSYPESFFRQQKKEFPHDGNVYLGSGSGPFFPTWKCPVCGRLHDVWIKKHGIR